jgi:hypothetical protein
MPNEPRSSARRRPDKQAKAGKVLQRAIDKSEMQEPPTVGKPVIAEPVEGDGRDNNQGTARRATQGN